MISLFLAAKFDLQNLPHSGFHLCEGVLASLTAEKNGIAAMRAQLTVLTSNKLIPPEKSTPGSDSIPIIVTQEEL